MTKDRVVFVPGVPEQTHRKLRLLAADRGISLQKLVMEILEEWGAKQK